MPGGASRGGVIVNRDEELRMRSQEVQKRNGERGPQGLERCLAKRFDLECGFSHE